MRLFFDRNFFQQHTKSIVLFILCVVVSKMQGQELKPTIVYSTYYGDVGTDDADAVTVDPFGNTYLGCHSNSSNLFKDSKNAYTLRGGMDAFVIKLNSKGSEVSYLTHLGGSKWDAIQGLISDSIGNIYAVGTTYSFDFPVDSNGFQPTFGGESDAFVIKLNPAGKVMWSTFLGGSNDEDGRDIAIDRDGNVYVIGRTASDDFPILPNALQPNSAGGIDVFVATLDTNGKVKATTYFGGSGDDIGFGIEEDKTGKLYLAGTTNSTDFPVYNALQKSNHGDDDLFFAMMDARRPILEYASYWGGKGTDKCYSIEIGPSGDLYILGVTSSSDLPITKDPFQQKFQGETDAFVSRLNLKNQSVIYSTYLGGENEDSPRNLAVDKYGNAYVVGKTTSNNFPMTNQQQNKRGGRTDAFVTMINSNGSHLIYSTLCGGNGLETFEGAAIGTDGSLTVSGLSNSTNFPLVNSIQNTFLGGRFDIITIRFIIPDIK